MFIWTLLCLAFISYYTIFITLVKSKDQIRDEPVCVLHVQLCNWAPGQCSSGVVQQVLYYPKAEQTVQQVLVYPS